MPASYNKENALKERPRVLAVDGVDPAGIQILEEIASVDSRASITAEELQHIIPAYDALIVRSATSVTETLIRLGSKLKVIGRAGVGVDNICLEAATARGIYVVNSPQGNTIAAAELALTLMMALSRKVTLADKSVSQGHWERSKFQGSQVHGKTIGIVGIGQVGSYIALICKSMEMEVLAYDPFVNQAKAQALGVTIVSLEDLLKNSDIVTLHVPLIPSTRNLIRAETLALMRPHALLINTSRGGVVDEAAVAKALTEGRLGGAALDVFCNERAFSPDNPLLVAKEKGVNLILTPHIVFLLFTIVASPLAISTVKDTLLRFCACRVFLSFLAFPQPLAGRVFKSSSSSGASTREAQINVSLDVAQQVKHILLGELPKSAVNLPSIRPSEMPKMAKYLNHAEILGRLSSQLLKHPMEGLHLKVFGDIENEQLDVLLLAVTQGALAPHCEHRVNFVNVRQLAAAHKIKLSVSKAYGSRSNVFFEVTVHSSDESASLGGCSTNEGTLILRSFKGMPIAFCMPQINAATPVHSEATTPLETSFSPASMAGAAKEGDLDSTGDSLPGADFGLPPHHYRPIYMFYTLHVASQEDLLDRPLETASPQGPNVSQGGASGVPQEVLGMCIFHIDSAVDENLLESIRQLQYVREAMVFATPCTLGQVRFL
ncbi:d-3-phosphoglycerate dehydrogenase [Cyclospora cayetanensis]|uniref:D-3-phosphoglycerate dehydrogenase n=1 Tax=Cyclospora cayetanensis TaxID=88456 RepID=A0A1D3D8E0_9EIME|nr:d-3-phosphoglycerate dehydrogenase [Cyclospora cayetanensis]